MRVTSIDQIMNPHTPSKREMQSALQIVLAVSEAIREAREIAAGTLYAMLMSRMDLNGFESMIRTLTNTGLVEMRGDMLRWIGPEFAAQEVR